MIGSILARLALPAFLGPVGAFLAPVWAFVGSVFGLIVRSLRAVIEAPVTLAIVGVALLGGLIIGNHHGKRIGAERIAAYEAQNRSEQQAADRRVNAAEAARQQAEAEARALKAQQDKQSAQAAVEPRPKAKPVKRSKASEPAGSTWPF